MLTPMRDLYVQALISMEKVTEDDWFSYFQLAGTQAGLSVTYPEFRPAVSNPN